MADDKKSDVVSAFDEFMNAREKTETVGYRINPVKAAIAQLIDTVEELERRVDAAEQVAWTFILNLERSDISTTSVAALRDYATNEARPFLLRTQPNDAAREAKEQS